jgi:hypothetical protein
VEELRRIAKTLRRTNRLSHDEAKLAAPALILQAEELKSEATKRTAFIGHFLKDDAAKLGDLAKKLEEKLKDALGSETSQPAQISQPKQTSDRVDL